MEDDLREDRLRESRSGAGAAVAKRAVSDLLGRCYPAKKTQRRTAKPNNL